MRNQFHETKFETDDERRIAASLPASERQAMVETLLVRHPVFNGVQNFLKTLHRPVNGGGHGRGEIGGLLGNSRTGKSASCFYYTAQFPMREDEFGEKYPVVYVEASSDMSPALLAQQLMEASGMRSFHGRMKVDAWIVNACERLSSSGVELVIIDDAQFLFENQNRTRLGHYRSFLKRLADVRKFNILLAGDQNVEDSVVNVPYLIGRGGFPRIQLNAFSSEGVEKKRFQHLLNAVDMRLPFAKTSQLGEERYLSDFFRLSDGILGRVMNVVRSAAFAAINQGSACILVEHLREAADVRRRSGDQHRYFA